jgi:hypothetical protein
MADDEDLRTVKDLTTDPANANKGTQRGRAMVAASVRRYGFGRSVLVGKAGRLIAGNKTVEAAATMGDPDVVVVKTTGKSLVVVQRTDLDEDSVEARELAVADNRASEVGLEWDTGQLKNLEGAGGDVGQFFRPPEWAQLLTPTDKITDATIPEMQCQPFEHHDYLMIVFDNSNDWSRACEMFGVRREAATVSGGRKIGLGRVLKADRFLAALDAQLVKPTP